MVCGQIITLLQILTVLKLITIKKLCNYNNYVLSGTAVNTIYSQ